MTMAVVLTFMQSLEFRNSYMNNNLDIDHFLTSAFGTDPENPPQKFDKTNGDCSIRIEGEAGLSGTWLGISYTIPAQGWIRLTKENYMVNCPIGTQYLREDCTTRDCP